MYRATTPTHTFNFGIAYASINEISIVYSQDSFLMPYGAGQSTIILKLSKTDLTWATTDTGCTATYTLSQQETANFIANVPVKVQCRIKLEPTTAGAESKVICSDTITFTVEEVLDDEEL